MLYTVLENIIKNKGYATKEEIQSKVDIFYARSRLTTEEYNELCDLINATYL